MIRKIFFLCISFFQLTYAQVAPIYVDSADVFHQIPAIKNDVYNYLKNTPLSFEKTRFVFIRHGESTSNQEKSMAGRTLDVDLSDKGQTQALTCGLSLLENGILFDRVYSSPSLRAKRTAELVLEASHQKWILDLDERLYEKFYGPYEGASENAYAPVKRIEEIENSGPQKSFTEKFHFKAHPDMESMAEIHQRVLDFLFDIAPQLKGKTVFVATHNGVMKALFMADAFLKGYDVDYRSYDLGNCSLVIVEVMENRWEVCATNGLKFRTK